MRARIEEIDNKTEAHVYEADMSDLHAVAEHCKALRSIGYQGPDKEMKLVASVPAIIVQKYLNDNGVTLAEFLREPKHADRLLSDPALSAFRVWGGRL